MSKPVSPQFRLALLHPRYWLTWLGFGWWALAAQLPYGVLVWLGKAFGWLILTFAVRRRHIVERNIALCFPHQSQSQQVQLVRDHFQALGIGIFETGIAWFAPRRRLQKRIQVAGMDNVQSMLDNDQGILFLVPHFTALEILGVAINQRIDHIDQTYRPHNNPVYDWLQSRARLRHNPSCTVLAARDVRGIVRSLKQGRRISFLPDQDYGRKHSVFAPFFGVAAATVTSMARLAQLADVKVVPLMCYRTTAGNYQVEILPPLMDFPSGDDIEDARRVNQEVERCIHYCPEQYLWSHRRFKTRPEGEDDLYQLPMSRAKLRRRERKRQQRQNQAPTN